MKPDEVRAALDALTRICEQAWPDLSSKMRDAQEADETIVRAVLEAQAKPQGDGWRAIESAPKDGSAILVFIEKNGQSWHDVAHYNDFEGKFMSGSTFIGHDFITHWQPLPSAPQKGDQ